MGDYLKNTKKMIFIALLDAITSEMYLGMIIGGFRISVSVIILPIFYYLNRKVNPIITSFYIGFIGLLSRGLINYVFFSGGFYEGIVANYQIFIFDVFYSFIYYVMFTMNSDKRLSRWYFTILTADFVANAFELVARIGVLDSEKVKFLYTLLIVSMIRSSIAILIILIFKGYKRLLSKEEHEERYKELLTFISDLKGEIYFMKNNMEYIEAVMGEAYDLFENLDSENNKFRDQSLQIATDVHEIKKNYYRVITGIEQISELTINYDKMMLHDLLYILENSMNKEFEVRDLNIDIIVKSKENFPVKNHYLFMSIMRNIVTNAVEAVKDKHYGEISLEHSSSDGYHIFKITDNGKGIKEKEVPYIFDPGYSTKFNEQTGDIYRGLGLTLVKDIVENTFDGQLDIKSILGEGTRMTVKLRKELLEVNDEILYY